MQEDEHYKKPAVKMCTGHLNSSMFRDVERVHTRILFCANDLIENGRPKDSWDYGITQ